MCAPFDDFDILISPLSLQRFFRLFDNFDANILSLLVAING